MGPELLSTILVSVFIALLGTGGTILSLLISRKEKKGVLVGEAAAGHGEAAANISEGFQGLVESLERRVDALEYENLRLKSGFETENAKLEKRIEELELERVNLLNRIRELEANASR